ncbi:lysostaphin resistance A-like protein [Elusimicrobiota bacterium]
MAQNNILYPLIFIILVLVISWAYTVFLFLKSERAQDYRWIIGMMGIPACVALSVSFYQGKTLSQVIAPLSGYLNVSTIVFAIFYPLIFISACAMIAKLSGLAKVNTKKLKSLLSVPSLTLFLVGVAAVFGEEYGWRGYLLPEITRSRGPLIATVIVGIVWALWHGPLVFGLSKLMRVRHPWHVCLVQMGSVFMLSFPFAYMYYMTQSIIAPMIFHYMWNRYNLRVLGNIYHNKPGIIEGNVLLINGEGALGMLLGLGFMLWFVFASPCGM